MLRQGMLAGWVLGVGVAWCAAQGQPATAPASAPTSAPLLSDAMSIDQLLDMARQSLAAKQNNFAQRALEVILRQDSKNLEANLLLAQMAEDSGDLETARHIYKNRLKPFYPTEFRVEFGMGRIYVALQYWRQAVAFLESAERLSPADKRGEVYKMLAMAYRGQGTLAKALDIADKAAGLLPDDFLTRKILLLLRVDTRNFELAFKDADVLVQLASRQVREQPANFEKLKQLDEAYTTQVQLLRAFHSTLYVRNAAGQPTDQLLPGKEVEAASTLKQVVDILVAQAELQHTMTFHNLLPMAEKAVEYTPDNVRYLLDLGLLQRNTAHTEQAVSTFQKVLEKEPGNPDATRHLKELNAPLTSQPAAAATP